MSETSAGLRVAESDCSAMPANIGMFARVLRHAGLNVGSGRIVDAIDAVIAVGLESRTDFYWALHAVFVSRAQDHETFDQAFKVFWRNRQKLAPHPLPDSAERDDTNDKRKPLSERVANALQALLPKAQPDLEDNVEEVRDAALTWSANETFAARDFESMTSAELRSTALKVSVSSWPAWTPSRKSSAVRRRCSRAGILKASSTGSQPV